MRKSREKGSIVVEATISLTIFIFAIFSILMLVNVYFIQARMSVALNTAAKEISQYSYLYYALGVNKYDEGISENAEDSKKTVENTITGIDTMFQSAQNAEDSLYSGDFESMMEELEKGEKSVEALYQMYDEKLEDPGQFIKGMGKMALSELKEEGKVLIAKLLTKTFIQKNLKASPNDTADAFLRRYRVVGGLDGLDFDYSTLMAYGTSNQIQLCVTYDVKLLELFNYDITYTFRQVAKTNAWGNGISLIKPQQNPKQEGEGVNYWLMTNVLARGEKIVALEKREYKYTDSGHGFDAYEKTKNQFITIFTLDTSLDSYKYPSAIKNQMNSKYDDMVDKVSRLDEKINVSNKSGAKVSVKSNPSTRKYKLVFVVPEDSDKTKVERAVSDFKKGRPGAEVEVLYKYGTGANTTQKPKS